MTCLYGPSPGVASAQDLKGVPSQFAFCRAYCPDNEELPLHGCDVVATADAITEFTCYYGKDTHGCS